MPSGQLKAIPAEIKWRWSPTQQLLPVTGLLNSQLLALSALFKSHTILLGTLVDLVALRGDIEHDF